MRAMVTDSPGVLGLGQGFVVFGHRGASGLAPENTLASFAKAVEHGVHGVELDVHLSTDGEAVVIHDERVDRTTNGVGLVRELSLAELRRLDAGGGEKIPTLGEVLRAVPASVAVNVELKAVGSAETVAAAIADAPQPILVSSFDHRELARFHDLAPSVPCAPLAYRWRDDLTAVAATLDAWAVNLADRIATPRHLAAVAAAGRRCLVYTIDNPARAEELRSAGVFGVITNRPDLVRAKPLAEG